MFKKLITLIILVPVGVVLVLLSVANRKPVTMALNPFDATDRVPAVSAPFFVYIFVAFILGLLFGSFFTWLSQRKHRKSARSNKREADVWRQEADKQKSRAEQIAGSQPLEQLPPS